MKNNFPVLFAVLILSFCGQSMAQNAIGFKEYAIEPAKIDKKHPDFEPYVLRLKLSYHLASRKPAVVKVSIDPMEEQNFQVVAEERVKMGRSMLAEFEIPIENWKTPNLNIYVMIQHKNPDPNELPLANNTRTVEKSSVAKP